NIVGKPAGSDRTFWRLEEILDPVLRNNGGPTLTHALVPGSAAIDAGDDNQVTSTDFDQRGIGFARRVGAHMDIGAYEMPRPVFTDSFERADAAALGAPWVRQAGALGINSNGASGKGAGTVHVATVGNLSRADVDLQAYAAVGSNVSAGLLARYSGPG